MFKVGDRVKCIRKFEGNFLIENKYGKVIYISEASDNYLVEFDKCIEGHNGNNRKIKGKEGHCWYVNADCLIKEKDEIKETYGIVKFTKEYYK